MNIKEVHQSDKEISAIGLFKGELGTAIAIQLQTKGSLKEHISKNPALLLCISGLVNYNEENEKAIELRPGDYVSIKANVKHWLYATVESQLILLK